MSDDFREERLGVKPDSDSPEWWAMDREYTCDFCGHTAHDHFERLADRALAACKVCECADFEEAE